MWALLFNFLGSGACGGLLGGIMGYFTRKDDHKHEQAMAQIQNAQQLALADAALKQTAEAGKQVVLAKEAQGFTESQIAAKDQWKWVRPVITFYLLGVATYFSFEISVLVGGMNEMPKDQLLVMYASIIDQIFFLTNLAVSWFFGARGSTARKISKH